MKEFLLITFGLVLVFFNAYGQSATEVEVTRFSDSLIKHLESLPDPEAFDLWRQSQDPAMAGLGMMDSALKNGRVDFLKRVFRERAAYRHLIEAVDRMPISKERTEMVLMMLRSESPFWHGKVEEVLNGSRGVIVDNAIEPFVGVIKKHLPALRVEEGLFITKAKRLELAADLEVAIGEGATRLAERPRKRAEHNSITEAQKFGNSQNPSKGVQNSDSRSHTPHAWWLGPITMGAGVLILGSLLWGIFKKAN